MFTSASAASSQKLSRKEILQRNPLSWILLLLISFYLFFGFFLPQFIDWQKKFITLKKNEEKISGLQTENLSFQQTYDGLKKQFDLERAGFLQLEEFLFPQGIDIPKIIRTLEIFSIHHDNFAPYGGTFQLEMIDLGKTTSSKEGNFSETSYSFKFLADYNSFRSFVFYLQKGELPERFDENQMEIISPGDYQFLASRPLPLSYIDSLNSTLEKDSDILRVDIKGRFFSQNLSQP